ncbi:hypothetical protein [Motilibacter aurantiacus]|uniref:hypothetical protein n=1 Tax=Motilibacter aurantiacus TaxID=2714955 RepID=UPI00140E1158|nr:hypothetical protein [Motilibacter aurantiacus]NHC46364.1 hypothetical protein [Motilibacter aurantiacus]
MTGQHPRAAPPPTGSSATTSGSSALTQHDSTRHPRWLLPAGLVAVLMLWALLPWEWSLVDDALYVEQSRAARSADGLLGLFQMGWDMREADVGAGVFRPSFYAIEPWFYALPVAGARTLRLALFLLVLLAPAVLVRRLAGGRWALAVGTAVAVGLANRALYDQLFFPSLQELWGLAFIALGLLAPRPWLRTVAWVIAAGWKAPFAWLLLVYALSLAVRRRWLHAAVTAAAGLGSILYSAYLQRSGWYTAGYTFTFDDLPRIVESTVKWGAAPGLALIALAATRGRREGRDEGGAAVRARRDQLHDGYILLGTGLLYLATLTPWSPGSSYYFAPPIWLGATGLLLILVQHTSPRELAWPRWGAAAVAAACAAAVAFIGLRDGLLRNAFVVETRDFALSVSDERPLIAMNGCEASIRFQQLLTLRTDGRWQGRFSHGTAGEPSSCDPSFMTLQPGPPTFFAFAAPPAGESRSCAAYYVEGTDYPGLPHDAAWRVLRHTARGTVYATPCPAERP